MEFINFIESISFLNYLPSLKFVTGIFTIFICGLGWYFLLGFVFCFISDFIKRLKDKKNQN